MLNKNIKFMGRSIFAAVVLVGSSFGATAEDGAFFGQQAPGKWIIGGKVANIDPNVPNVKDSRGVGVVVGYEFDKNVLGGRSSFELEYITGDEETANVIGVRSYEASALNAFFTFRSAGDLYFKLKGGISYVDVDTRDSTLLLNTNFEDTSLAVGIGLGYRIGDLGLIEVEYSQDSGDSDLGILGVNGLLTF